VRLPAWFRRWFSPRVELPAALATNAAGDPYLPGLPLEEARRRFRAALIAWRDGVASTPDTHAEMNLLYRSIFRRCLVDRELQSRDAYDFFNLASDVASATSYEPKVRWIADVALEMEAEALGHLYNHRAWGRIVGGRGPIESFVMMRCQECQLEFPRVGTSGFLMMTFLWCRQCGTIASQTVCNEETEKLIRPYSHWAEAEQRREAAQLGVPWRRCSCSGTLHETYRCPRCGSREERHDRLAMSPFEYFETHRCVQLDGLPVE
jgi:hypothetical protein